MATDANALFLNDASSVNTANGAEALYHNTTAFFNTAMAVRRSLARTSPDATTSSVRRSASSW